MSLSNIITGWANLTLDQFNLLDEKTKAEGEKRLLLCNGCSMRVNNTCSKKRKKPAVIDFEYKGEQRTQGTEYNGCGCNLSAKTLDPDSACPIGKWTQTDK